MRGFRMVQTQTQPELSTYADYRTWPNERRDELIEGMAYAMAPAPSINHQRIAKRRIYEAAGVREYWLVHPEERLLMIYRLEQGVYGKPDVQELTGTTNVGILPEVAIQWDEAPAARDAE
ncbi:Protein of unknown function (DUF820) [Thiocystis violascens DSM 198]|uniref:Putative restriction endonuclease domain-containing protein n=2 Tax=Thiocystis violascens TaxID=73141 RepID=I3YDD3_THIV6|nr:Protein of unknown function (DUF820) [Thiocystis violascens DSM 198]